MDVFAQGVLKAKIVPEPVQLMAVRYKWMGHFGPFDSPAFVADRVIFNFYFSKDATLWKTLPKAQSERVLRARL